MPLIVRLDDALIDGLGHAEVVRVDDQSQRFAHARLAATSGSAGFANAQCRNPR